MVPGEEIHTEMVGCTSAEGSYCIAEVVVVSHTAEEANHNCCMAVEVDRIHLGVGRTKEVGGCKPAVMEDHMAAGGECYIWGMTL